MTADLLVLVPEVDRATARLIESAGKLDAAGLAAASLCPGWTRGHEVATNFAHVPDFAVRLDLPDGHNVHIGRPDASEPTVSGPAHAVAAWLIGRGDGAGLSVSPEGALPPVPVWK